ncbi:histone-lysine N-methyltransferase, H3 lysine-9 specific SUVH5-like [Lolium rigidum]|uniref:histone-lysine N-methyltransferase, H3 lysine-9 specific SUVH5-like n=1 Tax=Lolium rigidum TaxID=89674 RepID=UPI001F5D9B42|nr:histone-lysine N-methyltransferase, H3 lysine-9 specific SUVH5-like [Lolium rigidum]
MEGRSVPGAETMTCGRSDAKHASERGANPQGFQLNPSMGKENSPPRDSKSIGFATGGGGAATGCRKGRKALVPWRFQIGYKRTWSSSQGLSPIINNGSDGPPGTRGSSKFEDGSRQCAPATAGKRSRVQFSAAAQVQTGSASSVPKEKKITPKNRVAITRESVMASLHEFRVIYKTLLEEEKNKRREQEDGTTHDDLGAFRAFRERFCVEHGDKRYEGSLPGVQVGDVFDSNKELFLAGLHRSQESCVDYIKRGRACLAVSIVSYAQHSALNHNLDFLLHVGSTAATADQKMEDISAGVENIPISAINSVSNEYPMPFSYISHMQYPINYQLEPPSGCDCVGGCMNSPKCACAVKNGGKIPFSKNGRTFGEKPLIYECGPSCKCPPTCHNRVSQRGIKFRLQVFKTKSMGWGVRTLDFIPNGSFVCEYTGELVKDEDAEKTENDEYLFNIGHNYYNVSRWDNLLKTIPSLRSGPQEGEVNDIAVDALKSGNFARFINHSCSGNLFSQNVLYDHDNKSMPHIALFADVDIPPLQPLSYDYNYTIDGVRDPQGNIKKKKCLCGSSECNGWLY